MYVVNDGVWLGIRGKRFQGRSYTTGTHDRATGPGLSNVYKFSVKFISQIKMILCSSQGQMLKTIHKLCFSA